MGGEKSPHAVSCPRWVGSPPRGRGKVGKDKAGHLPAGITPAWAGKSYRRVSSRYGYGDHPRVGGEKLSFNLFPFFRLGSPPRGRGKAADYITPADPEWITPAWAGKSGRTLGRTRPERDHPRVGGEKLILYTDRCLKPGSPPRGRGKASCTINVRAISGITPAWAGKSATLEKARATKQDHPRVGGEKLPGILVLSFG